MNKRLSGCCFPFSRVACLSVFIYAEHIENQDHPDTHLIDHNHLTNQKMPQEIERKFLVKGDFKPFVTKQTRIVQGYLSSVPERTVRVRIKGEKGFLPVKGNGRESGAYR